MEKLTKREQADLKELLEKFADDENEWCERGLNEYNPKSLKYVCCKSGKIFYPCYCGYISQLNEHFAQELGGVVYDSLLDMIDALNEYAIKNKTGKYYYNSYYDDVRLCGIELIDLREQNA